VLPGGRLTVEDAYAYSKFARVVLGTNDVDARVRPHSAEEQDFLAAHVAGRYAGQDGVVTYADLEQAPAVLLAGFEPEEESPIVFLRLRKAVRRLGTRVFTVAPFRSPGAVKTAARLLQTAPGYEAVALANLLGAVDGIEGEAARALTAPGAVVLVGERLAATPGALAAAARLATATGARLAWVPRRAGERGAVDVGALPGLLPGGRTTADGADVAAVWGELPQAPGRDLTGILTAARDGQLSGLVVGAVDPADCPDPWLALDALDAVPFLVSLELRRSPVTDRADVVLPVAAAVEKAGTFLDWEGRARPFEQVLRQSGALPTAACCTCWPTSWTAARPARRRAPPAPRSRLGGAADRAATRRAAPRRRPRRGRVRPCWLAGTGCSTTARCRTASRSWPARPRSRACTCRPPPPPRSGAARAPWSPSRPTAAR
jgi:NADH-quinone oxidoreductase subunit G